MASSTVIPLSSLKPGIVLPAPVYDGLNPQLLLLGKGTKISAANVRRLEDRGVSSVAIDSAHADLVSGGTAGKSQQAAVKAVVQKKVKQSPSERKMLEAVQKPVLDQYSHQSVQKMTEKGKQHANQLESFYESLAIHGKIGGKVVNEITVESVEQLVTDLDLYVKLALEPKESDENHQHCVRVSQLSMSIATVMSCSEEEVHQLGMGCLISRVGFTPEMQDLMESQRKLTVVEMLEVKKGPARTFNAMEKVSDIPVGARQVAYQIRERFNGTGYPRGRAGSQIHKLARIAAVADVFVALTSPRPHRAPFQPYKAVEQILADTKKGMFDPRVVRGLLCTVSLFPIGSCVLLNDGRFASVMRTNPKSFGRPVIRIIGSDDGLQVPEEVIDLSKQDDLEIIQALGPEDIPDAKFLQKITLNETVQSPDRQKTFDWTIPPSEETEGEKEAATETADERYLAL